MSALKESSAILRYFPRYFSERKENICYHWSLIVRGGLIIFAVVLFLTLFLSGLGCWQILVTQIAISLFSIAVVAVSLRESERCNQQPAPVNVYLLTVADITMVSALLLSFLYPSRAPFLSGSLMLLYAVVLALLPLYHNMRVCVFGCVVAIIEVAAVYRIIEWTREIHNQLSLLQVGVIAGMLFLVSLCSMCIAYLGAWNSRQLDFSRINFGKLVESLPEMIFSLDSQGKIIWTNGAAAQIFGCPVHELTGKKLSDFMVTPSQLVLSTRGCHKSFEVKDINGNSKMVECNIAGSRDEEDVQKVWRGIIKDVTDRNIAINKREEVSKRYYNYQKMESLALLASGMAHDFNNVLQRVDEEIKGVKQQTDDPGVNTAMDSITQSLADARFLISELLAFGREEQALQLESINIKEFLEETTQHLRRQLGDNIAIDVSVARDNLYIEADEHHLKQIFQNMIKNAKDAMPDGGRISIDVSREHREGADAVVVSISDTGSGIPADSIDNIFEPFFSTKKAGKGTGLGLALVKRILSQHNSQIWVDHSDGEGTTFKIEFPACERPHSEVDTRKVVQNRQYAEILLLDDDSKVREILKTFIKKFGYACVEAQNGKQAREEMKKEGNKCEVLIMDWKLEDESPEDVIKSLRKIEPDLIVIVVSGYAADKKAVKKLNIQRWFIKPYNKNRLDLEIQKAIYLKRFKKIA